MVDQFRFALLAFRDLVLYAISRRYATFILGFRMLSPKYMDWTSKIRARRAYYSAARRVPAYRSFVEDANITKWCDIPFTDKDTYVRKFSTEQRCVNGVLPSTQIMIDESSGSTGRPYNWVRNASERRESHAFISYFATFCYGSDPWITINAFSMGAWATGLNMGIALQRNGVVKNTGPDISKILHSLEFFGKEHNYLIAGYPPFLKQLMDVAEKNGFPLNDYSINGLAGGEGMSEGLRDYLRNGYGKVFSGYGATDLEIGIAGETPLTVAIRRLARDNKEVREALFGNDSRLPMVFQYNPIMHCVEVNSDNELAFTITRTSLLSPRIRYNIHDEGGIARYDQMQEKLSRFNVDLDELTKEEDNRNLRLPLMWVYGRKDFTISVMGANIYPEDLEQCIFADEQLSKITRSFCQSLSEGDNAEVRPAFYFEITVTPDDNLKERFADSILQSLIKLNADFREAWHEYPNTLVPEIHLFTEGEGPFKADEGKIKQARLIKMRSDRQ